MRILAGFLKVALLVACTASFSASANDLGQMGKTYPIAESDLIETIKAKLAERQASGELDALNKKWQNDGKQYVRRPPGKALPRATEYRAFAVDPTYTVPNDIKDTDGKVLYKAGFTFNPLQVKPLTRTLCFIDGDDPDQVNWLERYCSNAVSFKRILINGDFLEVSKKTKARIYFDQRGFLLSHFRIEAVPAVVRQSRELLYVEEFKL
jgi:conjugal transfer pilus assembly protein TraW